MKSLPQLNGTQCITDGGLETVFVFQKNIELPLFAAFTLLATERGAAALREYYEPYIAIARKHQRGLILDTPTWRASLKWGALLGHSADDMARVNQQSVEMLASIQEQYASAQPPIVINGVIGPEGDGYNPSELMSAKVAESYHRHQVNSLAGAGAEMLTAVTMTYAAEAIGVVRAAVAANIAVAVSFTVETDGRLPDGTSLRAAISAVDTATDSAPIYYMINCAHPTHFASVLESGAPWTDRIYGIRANASCKSHAELDEATELDRGDPAKLGQHYLQLAGMLRNFSVVGGCCGTDHDHIEHICSALA